MSGCIHQEGPRKRERRPILSKDRCYKKCKGEAVMQAKSIKGLWFVESAEKDCSFLTREKKTSCGISTLGMRGLTTLQSWPRKSLQSK
jgi:hypothetical protein